MALVCVVLVSAALVEDDASGTAEEFEYIDTPDVTTLRGAVDGTTAAIQNSEDVSHVNRRVVIHSPKNGERLLEDIILIKMEFVNASGSDGFSAMAYFGGGNPFPVALTQPDITIVVNDLAAGRHDVRVMLLNEFREVRFPPSLFLMSNLRVLRPRPIPEEGAPDAALADLMFDAANRDRSLGSF